MIDPISTTVISTLAAAAIQKSAERLIKNISIKQASKNTNANLSLSADLPKYLAANYAKCETLKTLIDRNNPVKLTDCFVAPNFELMAERVSSNDFFQRMRASGGKIVITGLAGSGKSVFLKYSYRRIIEENFKYFPVFFELRSLNSSTIKQNFLLSELFQSIQSCCESFTKHQFNYGLKSGAFCFLLDGFDELKQEIREQVSSEIREIARNHHNCTILVTSRPSNDFVSWEGFSEAKLLPFDLEEAVEYISKLKFDEGKKNDFLSDLKGGLFEKNNDFLSNPLLCAMMLLTYDIFGEIPEKRHIFYAKCFDVLAREHDASKGRYKRELYSSLTMEELETVFMFFCALSYIDQQISFDELQIKKYISDAISFCGLEAEPLDVINDFRESISILELVGLTYEFSHRSFQEYFYAKFVVKERKLSLMDKAGWLFESFSSDDTLEMIADMDMSYFEEEFLLPLTKALDVKLASVDVSTNPSGVLSKIYSEIRVENFVSEEKKNLQIFFTVVPGANWFVWNQVRGKYRNVIQFEVENFTKDREKKQRKEAEVLKNDFGGIVKIHHTNNKKMVRIGVNEYAGHIRRTISLLRVHLEKKIEKRKQGLGALMRKKYT